MNLRTSVTVSVVQIGILACGVFCTEAEVEMFVSKGWFFIIAAKI